MKHKLLYLLLALIILGTACVKSVPVTPVQIPARRVYRAIQIVIQRKTGSNRDRYACSSKYLTVSLNDLTKAYTLTGDTSMHAASFGTYATAAPYILFTDKTYPTTGTPTKTHLNGTYEYYYDGTTFQMLSGTDTTNFQYDLKRSK